jgi:hypothetical protein
MRKYKVIFYFYTKERVQAIYNSNAIDFISPAGNTGFSSPIINNVLPILQRTKFKIKANKNEIDVTNYYLQAINKLFVIIKQYD